MGGGEGGGGSLGRKGVCEKKEGLWREFVEGVCRGGLWGGGVVWGGRWVFKGIL